MIAEDYKAPTEEKLISKALTFMRKNYSHAKYQELVKSGELYQLAKLKAEAAKDRADSLITSGTFPGEAWNQAIRSEILESESD